MDNIVAEELNQEKMNEFDPDIFMSIAKIRGDGKRPYSESMFKYINSFINKYENVTLKFTSDRILLLPDNSK